MSKELYKRVGSNIRRRRERLEWTQESLADEIGISRPSLVNIEQGRQGIAVHRLLEFAEALGTTPMALLKGAENLR